jgi:transcriptional regulator with XRE-family HTH domain
MKFSSSSEKVLIEDIGQAANKAKIAMRGFNMGTLFKIIRLQLGMSQQAVAKRAEVPQSTISRFEKGQRAVKVSTLTKIFEAISCDLVIVPILKNSIEVIRRMQARKMAEKQVQYLKGTMNLEDQQPDSRFIAELIKQEEERLMHGPNSKLWEEDV